MRQNLMRMADTKLPFTSLRREDLPMMTQPKTADIEDVRLPLTFILSGLTLFIVSQGLLLYGIPQLIHGTPTVPYVLAIAHLLVLGFATMVAMGVMYQLVSVALQVKIHNLRLARYQYLLYTIGVLGMGWSFLNFSVGRLLLFASMTVLAVLLFEWNLWLTLKKAAHSDIKMAVASALTGLFITVGLGLWLVIDFFHPHLGLWHERILITHILFGTVGWFTMLIVGFSYKLAPMFTLSHGYESRFGEFAIYALDGGLIVTALGLLFDVRFMIVIGVGLLVLGFIFYGIQLRKILKHRMRKKVDPGVAAALFTMPFTLALLAAVWLEKMLTNDPIPLIPLVYLVIVGWIAMTILGYLYKIIPFLWWTYKYGNVIGKQETPKLKEMIHEKRGKLWLGSLFVAVVINTIAVTFGMVGLGWIGQSLYFIIGFVYVLELMLVLRK